MIQGFLKGVGVGSPLDYKTYHIIGASLFILFPVCMLRSVDSFRYATLISIGAILYTSLVLLIGLPIYLTDTETKIELIPFKFNLDFFKAFGLTFFAFYCQIGFFPAIENLVKLDDPHIKKVYF